MQFRDNDSTRKDIYGKWYNQSAHRIECQKYFSNE